MKPNRSPVTPASVKNPHSEYLLYYDDGDDGDNDDNDQLGQRAANGKRKRNASISIKPRTHERHTRHGLGSDDATGWRPQAHLW